MNNDNVKKRFQVRIIKNRKMTVKKYAINSGRTKDSPGDAFAITEETVTIPESYMVTFPAGHAVWFESKEAMARAGLTDDANFEIDMTTGEPVHKITTRDLEKQAMGRVRNTLAELGV